LSGCGVGGCGVGLGKYITFFFSLTHLLLTYSRRPIRPALLNQTSREEARKPFNVIHARHLGHVCNSTSSAHTPYKKTGKKIHPFNTKQGGRREGKLTLIRPDNNHGPRISNSIPPIRMPVARVVVRVVDEDLMEVWGRAC
jgi:hypothetical protein